MQQNSQFKTVSVWPVASIERLHDRPWSFLKLHHSGVIITNLCFEYLASMVWNLILETLMWNSNSLLIKSNKIDLTKVFSKHTAMIQKVIG